MEPAAGSKQSPPMGTGMAPGSSLCAPHFLAGALHTTKNPPKTNPPPTPKRGTQSRRHQPEMTFLYFRMERKWGRKGCTAVVQNNRWGWGAIGEATAHGGPRPHVPFAAVGRLAPRPGQRRLWLN